MFMYLSDFLKRSASYVWRQWLKPAAIAAIIILPLKSAVADWNWVPTGSMKPTILEGDLVLVNKLAYDLKVPFTLFRLAEWSNPQHGDIVVFFSPKDGTRLVKRVLACPGDTIEMKNEVLFLNGQKMEYEVPPGHPFAREIYEDAQAVVARETSQDRSHWVMALPSRAAQRGFPPVVVPEGSYFMMGDSLDNSFDSRFFSFVKREQIVGRTSRVLLSFDKNHHYSPRLARSFSLL